MELNFFRRIFKTNSDAVRECDTSQMPEGWHLTIDDLVEEMKTGKRQSIGQPEADWAREYELRQIPAGTRFAKKGDVYESIEDQSIDYLIAMAAPCTGGGQGSFMKGEKIWIHADPADDKPIGVYALPVEYELIEKRMVPQSERENQQYGGFYFYFSTVTLNQKFKLIQTGYKAQHDTGQAGENR